ncbi:hypothetical protein BOTBODRAFT_49707 [Botryobasidium botryosum FD-172 SS1]|uniref:Uncharacterized protein n=1 Tax=Botryobasidium botryosum (strain FD-172 SS1) TaxID=930990 RepID=A0A067LU60_BOTB1|nr:hypothetical protein BOTBODRAFT_49707 [Botryobasidium botryosum FD-172 SS1]
MPSSSRTLKDDLRTTLVPTTLSEFVAECDRLLRSPSTREEGVAFALTGLTDGGRKLVRLTPLYDPLASLEGVSCNRDYDSAIGITFDIPIVPSAALSIWPIPKYADTLSVDNHLTFLPGPSHLQKVPLFHFPNVGFGKVGERWNIRMMFPNLYRAGSKRNDRYLTKSQLTELYDDIIRAAVKECHPEAFTHWPANYESEITRVTSTTQGSVGKLGLSVRLLPASKADAFVRSMRSTAEANPNLCWARGFFFVWENKGSKMAWQHDGSDEDERSAALVGLFLGLDWNRIIAENWWVDVALEYYKFGRVLAWRQDSHARLLDALLNCGPAEARQYVRAKTGNHYYSDAFVHMSAAAGTRGKPYSRPVEGQLEVAWWNVYCSEKEPTYFIQGAEKSKQLDVREALTLSQDRDVIGSFVKKMLSVYDACAEGMNGNARVEIRIRLSYSIDRLHSLPDDLILHSLLDIDQKDWWNLKRHRADAIGHVLTKIKQAPIEARPAERSTITAIAQACSPRVATDPADRVGWEDDEDGEEEEEEEQGLPWVQKDAEDPMRGEEEEEEEDDEDVAIVLNETAGRGEDDEDARDYMFRQRGGIFFLRSLNFPKGKTPHMTSGRAAHIDKLLLHIKRSKRQAAAPKSGPSALPKANRPTRAATAATAATAAAAATHDDAGRDAHDPGPSAPSKRATRSAAQQAAASNTTPHIPSTSGARSLAPGVAHRPPPNPSGAALTRTLAASSTALAAIAASRASGPAV